MKKRNDLMQRYFGKGFRIEKVLTFPIFFIILMNSSLFAFAGDTFVHTHTDDCIQYETVLCDYPHEKYATHELITRHCENCGEMKLHSHYLTNYRCEKTGICKTVAGQTACLTCHQLGYSWGRDEFSHTREDPIYICGVQEGEAVARVHLQSSNSNPTNQDVSLSATVELLNPSISGSVFSYSWDEINWSGERNKTVSENGTYYIWVKNEKGEIANAAITINNIDKTVPTISSITHDVSGLTNQKITIYVSATDDSGAVEYSFDGGNTWNLDGKYQIEEGKVYHLQIRDSAGNVCKKEIRREDFPYPPKPTPPITPPTPSPKPDLATPISPIPDINKGKSSLSLENPIGYSVKKEEKNILKKENNKEKQKYNKKSDNSQEDKNNNGILVPKIIIKKDSISENNLAKNQNKNAQHKKEKNSTQERKTEDKMMENHKQYLNRDKLELNSHKFQYIKVPSILFIIFTLVGFCVFYLGFFKSNALYILDDSNEQPMFRRVQRIRIQKNTKGYKIVLPEYLMDLEGTGHFRILLSRYWKKVGKDQKVSIYTGRRKLIADMEECIDFVL